MARWFFSEKGINDKERDPGWDEYFSSNRSTVESLVRESIQNSLDAATKKGSPQALVRIYSSGDNAALAEAEYAEYLDVANGHYYSPDCGLEKVSGKCQFFVIEDFNTDGLTGDILAANEKEPYFKFLKCENKSTKDEGGSIGKWGIGKVVFPMASRLRTFFAYSIRNEPHVDSTHPREILAGECLLKYHSVGDRRYTPDGWWGGVRVPHGMNVPESSTMEGGRETIDAFKRRFNLKRQVDEPGLSVVVPYVDEIQFDELKRSIVENFMVAIVSGALKVELSEGNGPLTVYDAEHAAEIMDFLKTLAESSNDDDDTRRIAEMFSLVLEAKTIPQERIRRLPCYTGSKPDWQAGQFSDELVKAIQNDLARQEGEGQGKPSVIEVPIRINRKHVREMPEATFRVVLRRCRMSSAQVRPRFYRNGLFISHVGANRVPGFLAVVILDGAVADMLNEAEPPSHTQWFANTGSFDKLFNYAPFIIDYVRRAPRQIVKYIDVTSDEDDFHALAEFFSISRAARLGNGTGEGNGEGGEGKNPGGKPRRKDPRKHNPNRPHPPPPLPKPYILHKYTDEDTGLSCFRVEAHPEHFRSFMFTATIAYATLSGKIVYDKNDFSLQKGGAIRVFAENARTRFPEPNVIEALIGADQRDFLIELKGFDPNRDLDVDDHYRDPSKWNTPAPRPTEGEVQHG